MHTYNIKLRHILPAYLFVTIGTLLAAGFIRYFLAVQLELLDFKSEVWDLWIPMALPWIPITIWLRPKYRVLTFEKGDIDQRRFLFQILAWGTMAASLMVSQNYLSTASGTIQDAADIAALDKQEASRYYRIASFETLANHGAAHPDVRPSGKHNENLNIHIYFVCPMVNDSSETATGPYTYWFGVSFKKQISNRLSLEEKEKEFDTYYKECARQMDHYAYRDITYFERLPNSDDREGFLKAVAMREEMVAQGAVILEPSSKPFESRSGNLLPWILGSYLIGTAVFLLALLWPAVDVAELDKQRTGKKAEEDDVVDMLKFLIPRKPHVVTALVLDINIAVFLIMLFTGIHIMSPNGAELLTWGANRRLETTSGEWWRLLTSVFVHGGVLHLLLNIYGLVLASIWIEPVIGAARYAIIYFVSGIAGSLASIWWYDNTVSVGASGAIFGLVGALLAFTLTGIFEKETRKLLLAFFGPYVIINLLMGLGGGIDNAAHIGGLISGAVVALIIARTVKPRVNEDSSL